MKSEDLSPRLLESATCPIVSQMSPGHGLPTNFLVITDHYVINDWLTQWRCREPRDGGYANVFRNCGSFIVKNKYLFSYI